MNIRKGSGARCCARTASSICTPAASLAIVLTLAQVNLAHGQSTINGAQPATNANLTSLAVRQQFQAAASDINGLLSKHASTSTSQCPSTPYVGEDCLTIGSTPYNWNIWTNGTAGWVTFATINPSTGVVTVPLNSSDIAASNPLSVSFPSGVATVSLNFNSSLVLDGSNNLGINLANPNTFTATQTFPAGSITNGELANSMISGISLGSNLDALTFGTHLTAGGTSYNGSAGVTISTDATSLNTVSTLVARDSSGNFAAGTITASLTGLASLNLPLSGGTMSGNIAMGGNSISGALSLSASTLTSTVSTGTAPFSVASSTNVANLNASSLNGATFAAPGPIGSGTASSGAFTTLSASGTVSGTGFSAYLASPPAIGGTTPNAITGTSLTATTAFNATGLVTFADVATAAVATSAQYMSGAANVVVPASQIFQAETTTTFGTTTTFDFSTFIDTAVTLTGNITSMSVANVKAGQAGSITFIQDGTGSRTTVWNSIFKFAGGVTPALSTTAGAIDVLFYSCRSSTVCPASLVQNMK